MPDVPPLDGQAAVAIVAIIQALANAAVLVINALRAPTKPTIVPARGSGLVEPAEPTRPDQGPAQPSSSSTSSSSS